jgi:pyruvate dehydrogenase E2 component (dihydrolipoamide acetyltransferase)
MLTTKKISLLSKELKEVSELCRNLKIDKKELFGGLYDYY